MLHRVEHRLVHGPRHQQRADRHVAARERLRDRHEIGLEPPVLEREQLARAAEAGLHLVDAEERAVAAAELLRAFEVAGRRQVDALALHRLDEEERDVLAAAARARARRGRRTAPARSPGSSGPKRSVNSALPFAESEPSVSPWKPCSARDDARAPGRRAAELQRRLDRLGARAREEHALEPRRRAADQLLGEQRRQRRCAELHRAGQVELERLDERRAHARVVAADVEHPEAAEHVEVLVAARVPEVRALGARPTSRSKPIVFRTRENCGLIVRPQRSTSLVSRAASSSARLKSLTTETLLRVAARSSPDAPREF